MTLNSPCWLRHPVSTLCLQCALGMGPSGLPNRVPGAALGAQELESSCRRGFTTLLEAGGQNGWFPWPCPRVGDLGAPCGCAGADRKDLVLRVCKTMLCMARHTHQARSRVAGTFFVPASLRAERLWRLGMLERNQRNQRNQ